MKNRFRWAIGLVLCGLSAALLLAGGWPVGRVTAQFDIPASAFVQAVGAADRQITTDTDGRVLLPAQYRVTLDAPAALRSDGEQVLRLTFWQSEALEDASPLACWQTSVEGSLNYPRVGVRPAGSIYRRVQPEQPAVFEWRLSGGETSQAAGTLQVYLLFFPPQGGEPVRVIALARSLDLAISNPLGIRTRYLNIAGCLGLLASGLMLSPAFAPLLLRVWRAARAAVDKSDK